MCSALQCLRRVVSRCERHPEAWWPTSSALRVKGEGEGDGGVREKPFWAPVWGGAMAPSQKDVFLPKASPGESPSPEVTPRPTRQPLPYHWFGFIFTFEPKFLRMEVSPTISHFRLLLHLATPAPHFTAATAAEPSSSFLLVQA